METYKLVIKSIFLDAFWEILYFPIWWYSRGFKKAALFCLSQLKYAWRVSGTLIILRSFFKPMYNQRGWDAYLLSLIAHFWQISWRLLVLFLYLVLWLAVLLFWLFAPFFILWQLFF